MTDKYNVPYKTFQAGDDIESTQFNSDFAYVEDALNELYTDSADFVVTSHGTTDPSSIPASIGLEYINTTTKKVYKSVGTSSISDWVLLN